MLAIGFLSLLSLGLVGMAASGGDDDDEMINDDVAARQTDDEFNVTYGPVGIEYFPEDDVDPEVEEQINDFIAGIEADPNRPIEDVVNELHDFLDGLEEEGTEAEAETEEAAPEAAAAADEEPEFARPPTGEGYRDPIIVAEERAIAAAQAREPVNLVTVSDETNTEVNDALVLSENVSSDSTGEPAFTVEPAEGPNAIIVNFDYAHTFQINYTEETTSVMASLNSDIQGPEPESDIQSNTDIDNFGAERTTTIERAVYSGSTDITLSIDIDQIGVQFSKIDLSNPADTLHLEFEGEIPGNIHMITAESESEDPDDDTSTTTVYIIHTPEELTAVSQSAINAFNETDDGIIVDGIILAEVYLGQDKVEVLSGSLQEGAYEVLISNLVNDTPAITSNIEWTSTGAPTTDTGNTVTDNNANSGNTSNPFEAMFLPTDINPFGS